MVVQYRVVVVVVVVIVVIVVVAVAVVVIVIVVVDVFQNRFNSFQKIFFGVTVDSVDYSWKSTNMKYLSQFQTFASQSCFGCLFNKFESGFERMVGNLQKTYKKMPG